VVGACRASETCELYEGDPALLGASFACARPDACVPYYACHHCDEDLCAVGYVPGCKLSEDATRCEADDAALACSNVNCGACGAGAECDALLLCSTTPFGTCAQDLSFLEDGMGPCRAELCELCPVPQLCDAAPGCAFGDACAKDEAYYGCGAQACGPASCALCATASACDAVPGCASQGLPGAGQEKSASSSLQLECSARARSVKSIHASRALREMIARPKVSRNEWETTEI